MALFARDDVTHGAEADEMRTIRVILAVISAQVAFVCFVAGAALAVDDGEQAPIASPAPIDPKADPPGISPRQLVPILTRSGVGPDQTLVDVIYAPPLFFEVTGIPTPPEMETRPTLAFILQETVHDGLLPLEHPDVFMLWPEQGGRVEPYLYEVATEDDHHRTSRLLFPQPEDWPQSIMDEAGEAVIRIVVPLRDGNFAAGNTFEWIVPLEPGESMASDPVSVDA